MLINANSPLQRLLACKRKSSTMTVEGGAAMPDLVEQQPYQENLSLGITGADWAAVEELLRQLEEERAREATVEQIGFWLSAVSLLRRIEDRLIYLGQDAATRSGIPPGHPRNAHGSG